MFAFAGGRKHSINQHLLLLSDNSPSPLPLVVSMKHAGIAATDSSPQSHPALVVEGRVVMHATSDKVFNLYFAVQSTVIATKRQKSLEGRT